MTQEYTIQSLNKQFLDSEDRIEGRVPFLADMAGPAEALQATPQAMLDVSGPLAKGVVQGALGFPADLIGLATGLLNMATVDPEQKGNLKQFAEGYETVPFTSEKIAQMLNDMGWSYQGESEKAKMQQGIELGGEIISPTKALEIGITKLIKGASQ